MCNSRIFLSVLCMSFKQIINCTSEFGSDSEPEGYIDRDEGDESSGAETQDEDLLVSTRSGRVAGNWRLSSYIGKKRDIFLLTCKDCKYIKPK